MGIRQQLEEKGPLSSKQVNKSRWLAIVCLFGKMVEMLSSGALEMEEVRGSNSELIALMPTSDLFELATQAGYTPNSLKGLLERVGMPTNLFERSSGYAEPDEFWRLFSAMGVELDDEQFGLGEYPMPSGTTELIIARALHEENLGEAMISMAHAAKHRLPQHRNAHHASTR
ncbi:MAG: hypothetical protein GKR90_14295 [Pseudomonadales bacterium]|nr:hypothetical protein [Pseudomonadales bacterium]